MGDSHKDDKKKISDSKKEMSTEISKEAAKENRRSKAFKKIESGKNPYDSDYVRYQIGKAGLITGFRTLMGRFFATIDKRKYIKNAREAAKRGDSEEVEQDLEDARIDIGATLGEVRAQNSETRNIAHRKISTNNRVESNSRRQARSITQMKKEIDDKDETWRREVGKGSYRNSEVARDIEKLSKRESGSSFGEAYKEQRRLKRGAKRSLYTGHIEEAVERSAEAGRNSTRIMSEAEQLAEIRRDSFEDVKKAYGDIHMASQNAYGKVFREHFQEEQKAESWQRKGKDAKIVRKVITGVNKGVSFAGKFRAELRIDRAKKKAERSAVEGDFAAARDIMRKAEKKSVRTVKITNALNSGTRALTDAGIKLGKLPAKLVRALETIGNKSVQFESTESQLYGGKSVSLQTMSKRRERSGSVVQDLIYESDEIIRSARSTLVDYEPTREQARSKDAKSKDIR